ncbi:MAG: winged helix-turn-helix transcriptional regulator [Candidatus Bathyarchaeia archaeon]
MKGLKDKVSSLLTLDRAPSQFSIFIHLVSTGRSMTIKEISEGLSLSYKAAERAVAKLLDKGLIQRLPFKEGTYICDTKQVLLCLLLACSDMNTQLQKQMKS